MKYQKKPVVIDAFQWTGLPQTYPAWIDSATLVQNEGGALCMEIKTPEGPVLALVGDWIICGANGELRVCRPDLFASVYEPAAGEPM